MATEIHEVVVYGSAKGYAQEITVGGHHLAGDEPTSEGGTDTGPGPYDLLLAALGTCTSMTVALYARRKQWPLESVKVRLRHSKVHAEDCVDIKTKVGMVDRICIWTWWISPVWDQPLKAASSRATTRNLLAIHVRTASEVSYGSILR